jgi:predicted esterase
MNQSAFLTRSIPTQTHGRILVEDAADSLSGRLLVAFHGYGESAYAALDAARRIPGVPERWRVLAIQALHRFYTRDQRQVIASWMTRQDRDDAIADNIAYVDAAIQSELDRAPAQTIAFVGFSQGVAMAYRAAMFGRHSAQAIVALAADIPPEIKQAGGVRKPWPRVLIGVGTKEEYYSAGKLAEDTAFLASHRVTHEVCRFEGGHEWTNEFLGAAGRWLTSL